MIGNFAIQQKNTTVTTERWQHALAQAVRRPEELFELLNLPQSLLKDAHSAAEQFELKVPRSFIARMKKGDLHDPLLRQVLPLNEENRVVPGFSNDPVGDLAAEQIPGLLQKYAGRALTIASGACAVHCRYCFRRHFPYQTSQLTASKLSAVIEHIKKHPQLNEVILSGGDPLTLSNTRLKHWLDEIRHIKHIKRVRIHSRLPIVLPERIDHMICGIFDDFPLPIVFVIHANHANEIDDNVKSALNALHSTGTRLLNQSVLLKGVNDNAASLVDLSERLFDVQVTPYYLHALDKVAGAAHFFVSEDTALELIEKMRHALPGYLVPQLVTEEAGKASKTPLIHVTDKTRKSKRHKMIKQNTAQ